MQSTSSINDLKTKGQPANIRPVNKNPKPLHLGQVLDEVYIEEMGLNQSQLAAKCKCSPRKINEIVNDKGPISPEFAIILEKVLGTTAEMRWRMQADYDLWSARGRVA
jgi:addiction module HigA family antidote